MVGSTNIKGELTSLYISEKSIDTDKFLEYLAELRHNTPTGTLYIFLDNLPIHWTIRVRNYCGENNIQLLFNGIMSSEFNPVERLWAYSKSKFRRDLITFDNFKNVKLV